MKIQFRLKVTQWNEYNEPSSIMFGRGFSILALLRQIFFAHLIPHSPLSFDSCSPKCPNRHIVVNDHLGGIPVDELILFLILFILLVIILLAVADFI